MATNRGNWQIDDDGNVEIRVVLPVEGFVVGSSIDMVALSNSVDTYLDILNDIKQSLDPTIDF